MLTRSYSLLREFPLFEAYISSLREFKNAYLTVSLNKRHLTIKLGAIIVRAQHSTAVLIVRLTNTTIESEGFYLC